ncbi:MAG: single-stranded DNA-binding protein [Ruminococcus sp.]|nr:single-stranded DNA-binding protein [Ruminococcus sp.]
MNKVMLVGRLTRDPETRTTHDGKTVARFSVAVDRKFKNKDGGYDADFPNCTAFDKTADFIVGYFKKGNRIGIEGRLQTGSYTNNNGVTVYTTDVIVENAEFVENKTSDSSQSVSHSSSKPVAGYSESVSEESEDDDYPFN